MVQASPKSAILTIMFSVSSMLPSLRSLKMVTMEKHLGGKYPVDAL